MFISNSRRIFDLSSNQTKKSFIMTNESKLTAELENVYQIIREAREVPMGLGHNLIMFCQKVINESKKAISESDENKIVEMIQVINDMK